MRSYRKRYPDKLQKHRDKARSYRERYPDKLLAIQLKTYDMTTDQYYTMLDNQNNVCKLCSTKPGKRRLAVDHCHKTGQVRGLLCNRCNMALGILGDSIEEFQKVIVYLGT